MVDFNDVVFYLYDTLTQVDRGYLEQYFDEELDKLCNENIIDIN